MQRWSSSAVLRVKGFGGLSRVHHCRFFSSSGLEAPFGFIGLGHMGGKMATILSADRDVLIFDQKAEAVDQVLRGVPSVTVEKKHSIRSASIQDIAAQCEIIFTMLPNDTVVSSISSQLLSAALPSPSKSFLHVSCSTISPATSRLLDAQHQEHGHRFAAAPVFARPDGIAKRQATWMLGASSEADRALVTPLLQMMGNVIDMGEDVGAANTVKLCGNFLIAVR